MSGQKSIFTQSNPSVHFLINPCTLRQNAQLKCAYSYLAMPLIIGLKDTKVNDPLPLTMPFWGDAETETFRPNLHKFKMADKKQNGRIVIRVFETCSGEAKCHLSSQLCTITVYGDCTQLRWWHTLLLLSTCLQLALRLSRVSANILLLHRLPLFFIYLKVELLAQIPASNDEKYVYLWKIVICKV